MKRCLKRIKAIDCVNSKIKGVLQTRRAKNSLRCCQKRACKEGSMVLKGTELSNALRERLHSRELGIEK
jgi:hypothetical protein